MALLDRTFATYYLERRLGGGGMGEVYLARCQDGREVALKLVEIRPDADSRDIVAAERVGARLQQLFGASDSRVPAVFGMGEAAGYFFIEMEYVDGCDLAELIARGMPPDAATRIAADVAEFLENAHGFTAEVDEREVRALVHADLKPKNIRVNGRGELKVLDFGISKGLSLSGRLTTAAFGSRSYMSPEWLDTGRLDHHVDLWALGVVLYEMLACRLPFQAENARQLELALRARTPPLPLPDDCPTPLQHVVLKALAPRLERRYQTAAAFKADLRAVIEGRPTSAEQERAEASDAEATRRTSPAVGTDTDATRRTMSPAPAAAEATVRTSGGPPSLPAEVAQPQTERTQPASQPHDRLRRRLRFAGIAIVLAVLINENLACRAASTLRAELPTRQAAELDAAWERYRSVNRRSLLGIAPWRLDDTMRDALVTHANRVIDDFRHDRPTVRERQWQEARTWLGNALRIEPGNTNLLARYRYCEGQLSRIDGEARLKEGRRQDADRNLHAAVSRFEEAARLDRAWADPWLGLLRVYVYGLEDMKKAVAALNEAERRGHRAGRREFALVGTAHQQMAERDRRACEPLAEAPRCECLRRSGELFGQAITWFGRAGDDPETLRGLSRAQGGLQVVIERMWALECPLDEIPASRDH